jgi:adenylate cyclase
MGRDVGDFDELLSGLTGQARDERADLIEWLLARGFDSMQIRETLVPVLLPANRVIGGDGSHASVPQICEATGFDEPLLRRLHRAVGLPLRLRRGRSHRVRLACATE